MSDYLSRTLNQPTPQSEPLDERQVANSAGGYAYPVDDRTRLDRFLILGSEGGSYYATERKLTLENAAAVRRCIEADGMATVNHIVEVRAEGRAPRINPLLFALAMCASYGDREARHRAIEALPSVAWTGSQLLQFADYANAMRGWGRLLRIAMGNWYQARTAHSLAYQVVKYRERAGWSHRDLLRKSHVLVDLDNQELRAIFDWVTHGTLPQESEGLDCLEIIRAFEQVKTATPTEAAALIRRHRMTWEMVPAELLRERAVWEALAEDMPLVALVRNLSTLTRLGVLAPLQFERVTSMLELIGEPGSPPIHPVAILSALLTYKAGQGVRGRHTWTPVPQVVDALDAAFDRSFAQAPRTGQRLYLGVDISGSMNWNHVAGVPGLTARMGAVALALAVARREPNYVLRAFHHEMQDLGITAGMSLQQAMDITDNWRGGRTDCALPMLDALEQGIPVDCFVVLTDSETWAGPVHPMAALRRYRRETGIPAKLVVVGMVSNGFSIADPEDAGALDVVGFDAAVPLLLAHFIGGDEVGGVVRPANEEEYPDAENPDGV